MGGGDRMGNKNKKNMKNNLIYFTDEEIEKICKYHNLKCRIASGGLIFVTSSFSNWRIFHKDFKNIKVYHENYKQGIKLSYKKHKKFSEGFHQQKIDVNNMFSAIRYIYWHDKKFIKYNKDYSYMNLVPNISRDVMKEIR